MSVRRVHRWLGVAMLAPLVVWLATGLLFHLKPGWAAAYEAVGGPPVGATLDAASVIPLDRAVGVARARFDSVLAPLVGAELAATPLGPMWRIELGGEHGGTALIDATTAGLRSPLGDDDVRTLATAAAAAAAAGDRYGELASVALDDDVARVAFTGGATMTVDRQDGQLSQRGPDTDRIEWLYRLHYLQWTGRRQVDRVLAVAGLAGLLALAALGTALLLRR